MPGRLAPPPPPKAKARPTSSACASSSTAYPSAAPLQERAKAAPVIPPPVPARDLRRPAEPKGPPPKGSGSKGGKAASEKAGPSEPAAPPPSVWLNLGFAVNPGTFKRIGLPRPQAFEVTQGVLLFDYHITLDRFWFAGSAAKGRGRFQ